MCLECLVFEDKVLTLGCFEFKSKANNQGRAQDLEFGYSTFLKVEKKFGRCYAL